MQHNFVPYIGPRFFEKNDKELFFGREYESRELCSRIIAHSIVLCYSQSGAGKTSLINAGVIPRLEEEGFDILPVARVSGQIPKELNPMNVYMFNSLLNWGNKKIKPLELTKFSMKDFLEYRKNNNGDSPLLIIFDQFEELFTHYQERWTQRKNFFEQIVESLEINSKLRVILVMREDYIAYLDPYIPMFPNKLNVRFRLERMKRDAAISAIIGPLSNTDKKYAEGVPEYLADELLKVRVNTVRGKTETIIGEYIEPVQLQVVCQNLWSHLPQDLNTITKEYIQTIGNVYDALRRFYDDAIKSVFDTDLITEGDLRNWFEKELITLAGTRGTVFRGAENTSGVPNEIIDNLEKEHIIRAEWRAGGRWYELTHDSLIKAVQDSNRLFNEKIKTLVEQYHQQGIINYNNKEYEKAVKDFNKAIKLDNKYQYAYQNKSLALNILGKNDKALDAINKAIEIDPKDAWAYSQRGKIYIDMEDYEKALIDLNESIRLYDSDKWPYGNKSVALNALGKNDEALEAINKVIE
ncbi:MAG: tetratricopeptide repeat protein, partial [Ignavibacteria bacterium]